MRGWKTCFAIPAWTGQSSARPQLTDKPLTGTYRTAFGHNVRSGRSIPRADLAHYMLAIVDGPATIGNVIGIAT